MENDENVYLSEAFQPVSLFAELFAGQVVLISSSALKCIYITTCEAIAYIRTGWRTARRPWRSHCRQPLGPQTVALMAYLPRCQFLEGGRRRPSTQGARHTGSRLYLRIHGSTKCTYEMYISNISKL